MSRLVDTEIPSPVLDAERRPLFFTWRSWRFRVQKWLEYWHDTGAWWEGEKEKRFWRVEREGGGIMDLRKGRGGTVPAGAAVPGAVGTCYRIGKPG